MSTPTCIVGVAGFDQYGNHTGYQNFEMAAESFGARGVDDGMDCGSPIWNSEGVQGDAEVWELTGPNVYIGRAFTPNHHGPGRFRGGNAWESLWIVRGSRFVHVTLSSSGAHNGGIFHKGLFGGYPAPGWKCLWARGVNLKEIAARDERIPRSVNEAEAMLKDGRIKAEEWYCGPLNTWSPNLSDGDLFGVMYSSGPGYGDPIEREHARIERDLANGLITPNFARKAYGYAKSQAKTEERRAKIRTQRLEESVPALQWWREERPRARLGAVGKLISQTFARSARMSDKIKDMYLDFWQLKEFPYTDTGTTDFHTAAPTGFYYPKSPQKPYKKSA